MLKLLGAPPLQHPWLFALSLALLGHGPRSPGAGEAQGSCNFEGFFLEMQDWGEFGKSGSQTDLEKLGSGSTVGREGVRESSEPSPRKGWEHIPGNAQGQGMGHRLHTEQKEGRFSLQGPAKSPDTNPGWPGSFFHDSRMGQQCRIHTDNQP